MREYQCQRRGQTADPKAKSKVEHPAIAVRRVAFLEISFDAQTHQRTVLPEALVLALLDLTVPVCRDVSRG